MSKNPRCKNEEQNVTGSAQLRMEARLKNIEWIILLVLTDALRIPNELYRDAVILSLQVY